VNTKRGGLGARPPERAVHAAYERVHQPREENARRVVRLRHQDSFRRCGMGAMRVEFPLRVRQAPARLAFFPAQAARGSENFRASGVISFQPRAKTLPAPPALEAAP